MPEVPAHEKVFVSAEYMNDSNHGGDKCVDCHGGDPLAAARAGAHLAMTPRPTYTGTNGLCSGCHVAVADSFGSSLHNNLAGIRNSVALRAGVNELTGELETAFDNHCAKCHTGCGDCHVAVPSAAGGGLLKGHQFKKTPNMTLVCTACHGSRVADEFKGQNEGIAPDVHYNRGMQCVECHSGAELHGVATSPVAHRYDVDSAPDCADCHPDDAAFTAFTAHSMHRDTEGQMELSCQVCHSVPYKNCSSCHVSLSPEGAPIYEVNGPSFESEMTFKIGYNTKRDALHPAKWVPVRHVPIDPNNYDHYGLDLLPDFDSQPTWRLATPHNIQRITPQNEGCMSTCHGQRALFLGPDDLAPYEVDANSMVVVPDANLP